MLRRGLFVVTIIGIGVLGLASALLPPAMAQQSAWLGEYFDNPNLQGAPVFTRNDPQIDFQFGYGSPGSGIPADYFSVRWTRSIYFDRAALYEFGAQTDDGVRVWVGNRLVINEWGPRQGQWALGQIYLTPGVYTVVMEYYEGESWAEASLGWYTVDEKGTWQAEYYDNRNLQGSPALTRQDASIAFDWGAGSPGTGISGDNFSARWTRDIYLPAGRYRFAVTSDDGARVWVDGSLVIDKWQEQSSLTHDAYLDLAAGSHNIRVEYFEAGAGASIRFWWDILWLKDLALSPGQPGDLPPPPPPPVPSPTPQADEEPDDQAPEKDYQPAPGGVWFGEYYDNPDLAGEPVFTRNDTAIDFDWGSGAPGGLPADNFSVRWTQRVTFTPGNWKFHARMDDGVRVRLGNQALITQWLPSNNAYYVTDYTFWGRTEATLTVEFFSAAGNAEIHVWFEQTSSR